MEFDVVVVGAGTAGMPCAIVLAEQGARVVVIEKDAVVGGALHLSAGQMSGSGSRLQRSKGIDDTPEHHLDDVNRLGRGKARQEIARLAVENAGATIDWLEELGFPFPDDQPIIYLGHDPYTRPRTYWGPELGVSILKTVQPRFEQLVAEGRIDLRLGHRLTDLIVEDGRVTGVRAERVAADGSPTGAAPVELRAGAVALTTGGYAASRALFDELHPGVTVLLGARSTSQGEGLVAARRIGAGFHGAENHLSTVGGIDTSGGEGFSDLWEAMANTNANFRVPKELYVNARGERYIAEDEPSQDRHERALQEQGGRIWMVFGEVSLEDDDLPLVVGWSAEMVRAHAAEGRIAWRADTVEELARRAGVDAAGLARTVSAWNAACAAGSDPLGRNDLTPIAEPPFYALRSEGVTVISWGGLTVDAELRVTDEAGTPIPGLYAAGEVLGATTTMGNGFCSGMVVTPAMTLGRLLGRRLAGAAARARFASPSVVDSPGRPSN
jgi:fumarate reductase flavoprotein subunit